MTWQLPNWCWRGGAEPFSRFLAALAKKSFWVRAEQHPLTSTDLQGCCECRQISSEGAWALLASPCPCVVADRRASASLKHVRIAGWLTSRAGSNRLLPASVGQHQPRYCCPPLCRERVLLGGSKHRKVSALVPVANGTILLLLEKKKSLKLYVCSDARTNTKMKRRNTTSKNNSEWIELSACPFLPTEEK